MEPDRSPATWKINRTSETSERPGSIEKRQHIEKQRGLKRTSSGIEGQVGTKKQKESMEWTPARQNNRKNQTSARQRDQTPPRRNMQMPVRQNIQTLNREQWQAVVRDHGHFPNEQNVKPLSDRPLRPRRKRTSRPRSDRRATLRPDNARVLPKAPRQPKTESSTYLHLHSKLVSLL
jgi:hypothetical protein